MSLSAWLRVGWFALAADVAYWVFGGAGQWDADLESTSQWHGTLNEFLFFGGWVLLLVLLVLSYLLWRVNEREHAGN